MLQYIIFIFTEYTLHILIEYHIILLVLIFVLGCFVTLKFKVVFLTTVYIYLFIFLYWFFFFNTLFHYFFFNFIYTFINVMAFVKKKLLKFFLINFRNIFTKYSINFIIYKPFGSFFDQYLLIPNISFFYSTVTNWLDININLSSKYYFYLCLTWGLNFKELNIALDSSVDVNTKKKSISIFTCLYSGTYKFVFITFETIIQSISLIFPSFSWVERELKELNSIIYTNLVDTRRLLTDYFQFKPNFYSYKTNNYSLHRQTLL